MNFDMSLENNVRENLLNNKTLFWDRIAPVYDIFVTIINAKTHRQLCREVSDLIAESDLVLECACGTGMLTKIIARKCKELTATDFSEKMLEKTKKKCRSFVNIEYLMADITDLTFESESFDKVVAGNVIHLLQNPYKALQELDRVCRPGGKIIIPTYININKSNKEDEFVKRIGKAGADFKNKFTFESYEQFFVSAGYSDVKFIKIKGKIPCSIAVIRKKN